MSHRAVIAVLALGLLAPAATGQVLAAGEELPVSDPPHHRMRLETGHGRASFPITCDARLGQLYFDQGVALLHGLDLRGADRSFHEVTELDPDCAMAYWGRAMAHLDDPSWLRPFLRRAVDRRDNASPRERRWIDALAGSVAQAPYAVDGSRLAAAFERIAADEPDDAEARAFYLRQVALNRIDGEEVPPRASLAPLLAQAAAGPEHPIALSCALLQEDAEPERALELAQAAVRAAPDSPQAWTVAARLQARLGRQAAAASSVAQALRGFSRRPRCAPLPEVWREVVIDDALCATLSRTSVTDAMERLERLAWRPYPAPALTLPDREGRLHRLADFRGAPVLLVFFLGAGCPHCFEQMHALAPRRERFEEAGIRVVTVSTDSMEGLSRTFETKRAEEAMPFLVLSDPSLDAFRDFRVFDEFAERPLHGMFLVDGAGSVLWQHVGLEPFMAIETLLAAARRVTPAPGR